MSVSESHVGKVVQVTGKKAATGFFSPTFGDELLDSDVSMSTMGRVTSQNQVHRVWYFGKKQQSIGRGTIGTPTKSFSTGARVEETAETRSCGYELA
jgi:hypothetical protein